MSQIMFDIYNIQYYYTYRAFGGQNKILYSTHFVRRAIFFNIARTLCDQSFNFDLRLRLCRKNSKFRESRYAPPTLVTVATPPQAFAFGR